MTANSCDLVQVTKTVEPSPWHADYKLLVRQTSLKNKVMSLNIEGAATKKVYIVRLVTWGYQVETCIDNIDRVALLQCIVQCTK